MPKKTDILLNIAISSSIGIFLAYVGYRYWEYITYPDFYASQSAPWYTGVLTSGVILGGGILFITVLRYLVKRKQK